MSSACFTSLFSSLFISVITETEKNTWWSSGSGWILDSAAKLIFQAKHFSPLPHLSLPAESALSSFPSALQGSGGELPCCSTVWTHCKKAGVVSPPCPCLVMLKILQTGLIPGLSVICVLNPTLKSISPFHSPVFLSSFPLVASPAASSDGEQPPSSECTLCLGSLCSHLPSRFAHGYHVLSFGLLLPCPFGRRWGAQIEPILEPSSGLTHDLGHSELPANKELLTVSAYAPSDGKHGRGGDGAHGIGWVCWTAVT